MRKITLALFVALFALGSSLQVLAQSGRRSQLRTSDEVVTLKGEITNVLKPLASFKSEDGKEYKVHLGPVWYWKQEKFELTKGQVEIVGETEEVNSEHHVYPYKMVQGNVEIVLASEEGVPKWMGRSARRGGRRHGMYRHHRCGRCGSCWN